MEKQNKNENVDCIVAIHGENWADSKYCIVRQRPPIFFFYFLKHFLLHLTGLSHIETKKTIPHPEEGDLIGHPMTGSLTDQPTKVHPCLEVCLEDVENANQWRCFCIQISYGYKLSE